LLDHAILVAVVSRIDAVSNLGRGVPLKRVGIETTPRPVGYINGKGITSIVITERDVVSGREQRADLILDFL
jgi:hypothetical protein